MNQPVTGFCFGKHVYMAVSSLGFSSNGFPIGFPIKPAQTDPPPKDQRSRPPRFRTQPEELLNISPSNAQIFWSLLEAEQGAEKEAAHAICVLFDVLLGGVLKRTSKKETNIIKYNLFPIGWIR